MSKMKATNHEFHRHITLPRTESVMKEAMQQVRKNEMLKVFRDYMEEHVGGEKKKKEKGSRKSRTSLQTNKNSGSNLDRTCPLEK